MQLTGSTDPARIVPARTWTEVGAAFIARAFTEGQRWHGEYDQAHERARIAAAIDTLTWRAPTGDFPMSPGLLLQAVIPQLPLSNVTAVAINGLLTLPDGPERGHYTVHGVEGHAGTVRLRVYLLDTGTQAVPLAVDENVSRPAL